MRRKSSSQNGGGYNNQNRRPRYQGGGGGGQNHGGGNNRPRRNYGAAREKYLSQARDALAAGDRVLAENYFQHADHCYRMMMEEGGHQQQRNQNQQQHNNNAQGEQKQDAQPAEEFTQPASSALPSFITGGFDNPAPAVDPASVQNWEERDA